MSHLLGNNTSPLSLPLPPLISSYYLTECSGEGHSDLTLVFTILPCPPAWENTNKNFLSPLTQITPGWMTRKELEHSG